MDTPLITVTLTTYNRCKLLSRAVNSVLNGTYENFELIIIDDASSDGTLEVASSFNDPRIQYVRMPENGGVLRARNRAFDLAGGDYITMLDDDDELLPDALSCIAREFANSENDGVDILWFDCENAESGTTSGHMPNPGGPVRIEDCLCGRAKGDFKLVFTKQALQGNRFDEKLWAHESLLWMRILRTRKARHVSRVVCRTYREHGGERLCDPEVKFRHLEQTALAQSQYLHEFGDILTRTCPRAYGQRLAYLGLHQMAVGNFTAGRSAVLRSLRYRPSGKYAMLYIISFFIRARHVKELIRRMAS